MTDKPNTTRSSHWAAVAVLMVTMFIVSVGYGVILPVLPFLIERVAMANDKTLVSQNTGLLAGTYTLALFLFAPLWGRLSDRTGRRPLIIFGLVGFALTLTLFGAINRLPLLYASRFLSGVFASAITPIAYALLGDLALARAQRAHRFALLNVAATAGFLVGPTVGGLILGSTRSFVPWPASAAPQAPFWATTIFALLAVPFVWHFLPEPPRRHAGPTAAKSSHQIRLVRLRLLTVSLVTASAIGSFEVGLSLRGKLALGLDAYHIGLMFTECSLVMFAAQGIVFSPLVRPETTRWLLAPGLGLLALGLVAVSVAQGYFAVVLAVGLVAASAGTLSPIVTYWISLAAGEAQGAELGLQTAAASFGQALGSAAGGLLYSVAELPGGPFLAPATLTLIGAFVAITLPSLLAQPPTPELQASTMASGSFSLDQ